MYRVLLIDDEPWALLALKNSIKWSDFSIDEILTASDPRTALHLMATTSPAIVISDICMPEISGLQLLEYAVKHMPETKFIFVSGYSDFEYAKQALRHGAFDYLLKPINSEELSAALQSLITSLNSRRKTAKIMKEYSVNETQYKSKTFIELVDYVDKHFRENLTLDYLNIQFHLNRTYISDLFKKHTGKSFTQYLNELRIRYACDLLLITPLSVQEIAMQAGYKDYLSFVRIFKKIMSTTPVEYRGK